MKSFNINNYILIQITDDGWKHLEGRFKKDYMDTCVKNREVVIEGESWYRLQLWYVFELFPVNIFGSTLFNTNIMIDEELLESK